MSATSSNPRKFYLAPVATQRSRSLGPPDPVIAERRRTLQTTIELTPQTYKSGQWTHSTQTVDNINDIKTIIGHGNHGASDEKKGRRQTIGHGHDVQTKPSILVTAAQPPPFVRSLTTPVEWRGGPPNGQTIASQSISGDRLSVNYSLRAVPLNTQPFNPTAARRRSNLSKEYLPESRGLHQPHNGKSMSIPERDSSSSTRVSGKLREEQVWAKLKASQNEGRRISGGTSNTVPFMTQPPVPRSVRPQARSVSNQQELLRNSRTMQRASNPAWMKRTISEGNEPQHFDRSTVNAWLLNGSNGDFESRPPSSSSTATRVSHFAQNELMLPLEPPPVPWSAPKAHSSYQPSVSDRAPRSVRRSSRPPVRSPSTHSVTSARTSMSYGTTQSHKPGRTTPRSRSPSSPKSRRTSQGLTQAHLDALAALTAPSPPPPEAKMTPESLALLKSQQRKLDEKLRRSSVASERAARLSLVQEHTPRSRSASRTSVGEYNMNNGVERRSRAGSRASVQSYATANTHDGMTLENIRLLKEREKLVKWKADREKSLFEKREREKIMARVKRANEMEEERKKELMEKKTEKRKKRSRFRGCFGRFWVVMRKKKKQPPK